MKSYNILKITLGDFLRILQEKTAENAYKMKDIYDYTKLLKKNEPDSEERKIKLRNALILNNEFIGINKKYIDLHNSILEIIDSLASDDDTDNFGIEQQQTEITNLNETPESIEETHEESKEVEQVAEEELELDNDNLLFQNKEYTNQLMQKYIEAEEYEKCDMLQRLISSNNH